MAEIIWLKNTEELLAYAKGKHHETKLKEVEKKPKSKKKVKKDADIQTD